MGRYLNRVRSLEQALAQAGGVLPTRAGDEINEINEGTPLRAHEAASMAALREQAAPGEHAESLEDSLRLGRRLALGEIKALRCGITGRYCRDCQGVPCLGSLPWAEYD